MVKNVAVINLMSRINVLGGTVAMELTDMELSTEGAEHLARKMMLLKELEHDIAARRENTTRR